MNVRQPEGGRVTAAGRFPFCKSQIFQLEAVYVNGLAGLVVQSHVFSDGGNLIIDGIMQPDAYSFRFAASFQGEHDFAPCGILRVERPPASFPGHGRLQGSGFKILYPERSGQRSHLLQPFRFQIAAFGLSVQPAQIPYLSVDGDGTLAAYGPQHAFTRHVVDQVRCGQIREDAELPCQQSVGNHDSFSVLCAVYARLDFLRSNQPVVIRFFRMQLAVHRQRIYLLGEPLPGGMIHFCFCLCVG